MLSRGRSRRFVLNVVKELRFFAALRTLRGFFADVQNDKYWILATNEGYEGG